MQDFLGQFPQGFDFFGHGICETFLFRKIFPQIVELDSILNIFGRSETTTDLGREDVGKGYGMSAFQSGFHFRWPANDERHAVTTFPRAAFYSANWTGGVMVKSLNVFFIPGGPIVAGEEEGRVVLHLLCCQPVEIRCRDLAVGIVGLDIAIAHVIGENKSNVRLGGCRVTCW